MVHQKAFVVGVPPDHGDGHRVLGRKPARIRRPDGCVHFGADKGIGNDNPSLFAVIGTDPQGEHAVDLIGGQRLQGIVHGREGPCLKMEAGVLFTGLGKLQVVRQRAGKHARFRVPGAEGHEIVPITHADRAVLRDPADLFRREEAVDRTGAVELLGHLLVEVAVVLENAVHRDIQVFLQVRAVFADAEVGLCKAHLAYRDDVRRVAVGVQRDKHVQLAFFQHVEHLRRLDGQLDHVSMDIMLFGPVQKELLLNAVLVDAAALAVHGGKIVRPDLGVVRGDEDMVALRTHRLGGIEDLFRPLFGVRHIAQQVDLAGHQLFKQFGPAAFDILIGPSGIDGDTLLILIAVAGLPPERIGTVKGRLVPADAHRLFLIIMG